MKAREREARAARAMTANERVARAARVLRIASLAATALRASSAALLVLLAASAVDALDGLPLEVRRLVPVTSFVVAVIVLVTRVRQLHHGTSATSVALWIEDRFPRLKYALVTAVDPATVVTTGLERQVSAVSFEQAVAHAARQAVLRAAVAALVCGVIVFFLPQGAIARVTGAREGDALERLAARRTSNPLATIVVRVTPPAYSRLPATATDDPASLRALAGSAVMIEGHAGDAVVGAWAGGRDIISATRDARGAVPRDGRSAAPRGGRWQLSLPMPAAVTAIRLHAAGHERLVVLEPYADSVPVVTLTLPERDSIYRRPTGIVRLAAGANDDFGLASGGFEIVVSSGNGEDFTFKQGMIGATTFSGHAGALVATLSLDSLNLQPGDILHLRAVARDRNDVDGPGVGASETRTLRIARADEYDSVAVDAAPPGEPAQNALSQRMILLLTEALERRRPKLARGDVVSEARRIAVDQTRLRKRVGELVFHRLGEDSGEESGGGGGDKPVNPDSLLAAARRATGAGVGRALEGEGEDTPLLAINRPLLEAYNHMWQASTELELGEPGRAVPWMRSALDLIQASRSAERVYLRGRTRAVVVDVERVRLQGKDAGTPVARTPRERFDPARARRLARFDAALFLLRTAPSAAIDSLLLLRVDAVEKNALAARALDDAANALRVGRDATPALLRARRALAGTMVRHDSLAAWGGAW